MTQDRPLRIAAVLSLLYVAVFIALQVYLPQLLGSAKPPTAPTQTAGPVWDTYLGTLLKFAHAHLGYFTESSLLTALDDLLLAGAAYGIYLLLRPYKPTAATITLVVGLLSIVVVVAGQIVVSQQWTTYADRFWNVTPIAGQTGALHALSAAQTSVVHAFQDSISKFQILGIFGSTGLALWLALIGVNLLRLEGMRSLNGWGTLAAGLLAMSPFPALPIWALGAGIGLWRISQSPYQPPVRWATTTNAIEGETVQSAETASGDTLPAERPRPVSTARRERQRAMVARGGTRGRKRR